MAFAISRLTPPPLMAQISIHFLLHFFLLQLNLTHMKWILHLVSVKNITFKSSYNWFEIDIQLFSHVQSHVNHYIYII